MFNVKEKAFTLAELLIALAILGVIATFTVPKILTAQQNQKSNALAKEVASMISGAYQAYQADGKPIQNLYAYQLTPYMNYVSVDTTSTIDFSNDGTTRACTGAKTCVRLHNGGILQMDQGDYFPALAGLDVLPYVYDPNGKNDGANTTGTAVQIWLYRNGRVATRGTLTANTCISGNCIYNPVPAYDPPWFSWN